MAAIAGKVAITPKGEWNVATQYEKLDFILHGDDSYVARKASLGVEPGTDEETWQLSLRGASSQQINDILNGTTPVGDSNSLGGKTAAEWQEAIDNASGGDADSLGGETAEEWQAKIDDIQTTCKIMLHNGETGWYRIAEYVGSTNLSVKGRSSNSCQIIMKNRQSAVNGETHCIQLLSVREKQRFTSIHSMTFNLNNARMFTKIRYTYDSDKAYLEVYCNATADEECFFEITHGTDYHDSWRAITPTLTSETVDGVTVSTTYDIPAISPAEMITGVEYLTNEYFQGEPVYTRYLQIGYLTTGSHEFTVDFGVKRGIGIELINNNIENLTNFVTGLTFNPSKILVTIPNNMGNVCFILKYTKA